MSKENPTDFIYLSQEMVKQAGLDIKLALEVVEDVFKAHGRKKNIVPPKVVLDLDERRRGRIVSLPSYLGEEEACGMKWIAGFPNNPRRHGLPRASAIIILNDPKNGLPLAVMDGTLISALRTGAVVGVGTKYLANESSENVGIVGAGVINRTSALALKETLPKLRELRVYDKIKGVAEKYAEEMHSRLGIDVTAVDTAQQCIEDADLIVTATVADEPIVRDEWVKEGSLFAHVGSYVEEENDVILNSDKIVVDEWDQVKHRGTPILAKMYSEGLIKDSDIYSDLGDIVLGRKKGREKDTERIFFSPIGMGSEDIAVAHRVYRAASDMGIGTKLKLWTKQEIV